MSHRPSLGPIGNAIKERLTLTRSQHLAIADPIHPTLSRQHDGTKRQGSGPGPTSHLIYSNDYPLADIPAATLFGK